MSPLFITFEGVDGAGKGTQAWRLWRHLNREGYPAHLTWEPGATWLGDHLRQILVDGLLQAHITPTAEVFLFAAARTQLVETTIRPLLSQGFVVVSDRYMDSTIAYQGFGRCLDINMVRHICEIATGGLLPDLTILLDIAPEAGLARKKGVSRPLWAEDRFEEEEIDFSRRVRQGYLELAAAEPERWLVMDATESQDEIEAIIWQRVAALLSAKERG